MEIASHHQSLESSCRTSLHTFIICFCVIFIACRNTLLFHQRDWELVAKAGRWALQGLRKRRLITLKAAPATAAAAAGPAAVSAAIMSHHTSTQQPAATTTMPGGSSGGSGGRSSGSMDGREGGSVTWELTPLGECVYHSALAPETGLVLYERLIAVRHTMVMSCFVQLVYVLQLDVAWGIYGWEEWLRLWQHMPASYR